MSSILVTGAGGFIGRHLCGELMMRGYDVVAAVRSNDAARVLPRGIQIEMIGDLITKRNWKNILSRVDSVVHLAAKVHKNEREYEAYRVINVDATSRLAEAAARIGVKRFIFLSTVKVHGDRTERGRFKEEDPFAPADDYAKSKCEAEISLHAIAEKNDLEFVIVRPPLVYGPGVRGNFLRLMRLVESRVPLPLGSVDNKRSIISTDNLCNFISRCIEDARASGHAFLVRDDEEISISQLIRSLGEAMERPARLFSIGTELLQIMAGIAGRKRDVNRLLDSLQVDGSKARSILGWVPPYSQISSLEKTAAWYARRRSAK